MSAYGLRLAVSNCKVCRRRAAIEVFNCKNSLVGLFCSGHAIAEVIKLDTAEKAYNLRTGRSKSS